MKNNKAAIELSIGTLVIIVLAMAMLIGGLMLVRTIFFSGINIAKMTDEQLRKEISSLFSGNKRVVVYPGSRIQDIEPGKINGFGIGITNTLEGTSSTKFSYEVELGTSGSDLEDDCDISEEEAMDWVKPKSEENIRIASGEFTSTKILLDIPEGTPLCSPIRYRINVFEEDGEIYDTDFFDINVK